LCQNLSSNRQLYGFFIVWTFLLLLIVLFYSILFYGYSILFYSTSQCRSRYKKNSHSADLNAILFYSILWLLYYLFYSIPFHSILFYSILFYLAMFPKQKIQPFRRFERDLIVFYSILLYGYSIPFHSIPIHSNLLYSIVFYSIAFYSILPRNVVPDAKKPAIPPIWTRSNPFWTSPQFPPTNEFGWGDALIGCGMSQDAPVMLFAQDTGWLIDWLAIDWLIDWAIDWLIGWSSNWMIDWEIE